MSLILSAIYFLVMFAVAVLLIMVCNKFIFSKVTINKYIPLAVCILGLIAQMFFKPANIYANAGLTIFIIIAFAWYFQINQTGGPKKSEKKIVMKPKSKPNRIKHDKK